ncbi:kinase-like domain-containing protein [Mortierella sp. GBAus27b]|nr:kinase-like domain-containing protein [Mortierella sp. GBAus27b]
MGNPLSKCCGRDTTASSKSTTPPNDGNGTETSSVPGGSITTVKDGNAITRISKRVSTLISAPFGPKVLSLEEKVDELPLTKEQKKALLENKIPPSEIKSLTIGVDAGGMGIIHLAEWKGQKVAIKEASDHVISKEVEIYSRMKDSEGVVKFFGVTCPAPINKICIVTKYAEKGSLTWHLKVEFETLTWNDKLRIGTQIASTIARLHKQGIYHRDLHGGNILIDAQGNAMLTDFGASTVMEYRVVRNMNEYALEEVPEQEGQSKFVSKKITGLSTVKDDNDPLIGIMAYIAPERFRNPKYFDAKCDIYSLGVLLWELTSGHTAFSKVPQDVHLAVAIMNGKRELPVEGTPAEYQALYEKCWQSDPSQRPSTEEIVETLNKVRASMSTEALAATHTRDNTKFDSVELYEESVSVPRPTSDIQQYILAE